MSFCCSGYLHCIINFKYFYYHLLLKAGLIYWEVLIHCFYSIYIFRPYLYICTEERLSLCSFVPSLLVECCCTYYWELVLSFVLDQLYTQASSVSPLPQQQQTSIVWGQDDFLSLLQGQISSKFEGIIKKLNYKTARRKYREIPIYFLSMI